MSGLTNGKRWARFIIVLGFVMAAIVGLGFLMLGGDPTFRFRHRSARYYVDFSKTCDSILAKHPLGTNESIEIPVTDTSLPEIIRELPPFKIEVRPHCLWILAGGTGHANGYGITWEPRDESETNVWVLRTILESHERIVYAANRE